MNAKPYVESQRRNKNPIRIIALNPRAAVRLLQQGICSFALHQGISPVQAAKLETLREAVQASRARFAGRDGPSGPLAKYALGKFLGADTRGWPPWWCPRAQGGADARRERGRP